MNNSIKKSIVGVVLLSGSMAVGFEGRDTHLINQSPVRDDALVVQIPEPMPGDFQVILPRVPLDQTAPKLAKIINCFTDTDVREKSTVFFQGQDSEARKAMNSVAKTALKAGSDSDQQQTINDFTTTMVNCVQQGFQEQHEKTCAALEQKHQNQMEQIRLNAHFKSKVILRSMCLTVCSGGLLTGLMTLLNAMGPCHQR